MSPAAVPALSPDPKLPGEGDRGIRFRVSESESERKRHLDCHRQPCLLPAPTTRSSSPGSRPSEESSVPLPVATQLRPRLLGEGRPEARGPPHHEPEGQGLGTLSRGWSQRKLEGWLPENTQTWGQPGQDALGRHELPPAWSHRRPLCSIRQGSRPGARPSRTGAGAEETSQEVVISYFELI